MAFQQTGTLFVFYPGRILEKNPEQSLALVPEGELYNYQVRQTMRFAMFVMNAQGILLSWNVGVKQLLGYSEEEWIGRHASMIFTPAEKCREVCESEMSFATEHGFSSDTRWHVRKDGTTLFAHGYMAAIREKNGELWGFSKILADETRTKELQDSLTESNTALEQFAAVASHDLQEPLRTVRVYAELLSQRHRDGLGSDGLELLDGIVKGAQRMNTLIQSLLTYARIETEEDRPLSFSLDQDLETALTQLRGLIEETGAVVTHDPLPNLQTDQGQMVRLFQNLIGNGLKYRRRGIRPRIHISAEEKESSWIITVEDNGIGFEPQYAEEIFLPFKRLHGRGEYEGTGVGLAICRRIVEAHGGRIWAESEPGHGSRFRFSIAGKKPETKAEQRA